jgi:hypothetical protein
MCIFLIAVEFGVTLRTEPEFRLRADGSALSFVTTQAEHIADLKIS